MISFCAKVRFFVDILADEVNRGARARRNQPCSKRAGKSSYYRRNYSSATATLYGPGHAKPGRARRRLSSAGSPARPLSLRVTWANPGHESEWRCLHLHRAPSPTGRFIYTDLIWKSSNIWIGVRTESLHHYIVDLAERAGDPEVRLVRVEGALCMLKCARARALLDGRHYFTLKTFRPWPWCLGPSAYHRRNGSRR